MRSGYVAAMRRSCDADHPHHTHPDVRIVLRQAMTHNSTQQCWSCGYSCGAAHAGPTMRRSCAGCAMSCAAASNNATAHNKQCQPISNAPRANRSDPQAAKLLAPRKLRRQRHTPKSVAAHGGTDAGAARVARNSASLSFFSSALVLGDCFCRESAPTSMFGTRNVGGAWAYDGRQRLPREEIRRWASGGRRRSQRLCGC